MISDPHFESRLSIENAEGWRNWCHRIPSIPMREDWQIKIVPPNLGAMARFVITRGEASVSVYLDVFDRLGSFGYGKDPVPHWEIYPDIRGENWRCPMEDVDELVEAIEISLDQQGSKMAPRESLKAIKPIEGRLFEIRPATVLFRGSGSEDWERLEPTPLSISFTIDEPLIVGSPEHVASTIDDYVAALRAKAGKEKA